MDPLNMSQDHPGVSWILDRAKELGFLEGSCIDLLQDDPNFTAYRDWVEKGHHEPLGYLGKNLDKREQPSRLEPDLESAFVFLHPYPNEWSSEHVARYAWGTDYHFTIREKLKQLETDHNTHHPPLKGSRICVDTVPILERSLAQRAGLGWIGKNGCLISRKHGSFFLIAVWLTNLPAATAPKLASQHCGTCTRCLEACPTDAFLKPGFLDAKLCLSTQTIENRGEIDPSFHSALRKQAFGCDICQEVCPWNRHTTPEVTHEKLPDLQVLLELDEKSFRDHFRNTPLTRPGWPGLRRNFLILASHRSDVPDSTFESHLNHPKEEIRRLAAQLLKNRRSPQKEKR